MRRIISDKAANPTTTFESPQKRYDQSRQRILVDDFDRDAIRRKIHHLYEQKPNFTLYSIHEILHDARFVSWWAVITCKFVELYGPID